MGIDYNSFSTEEDRLKVLEAIKEKYGDELNRSREREAQEEKNNQQKKEQKDRRETREKKGKPSSRNPYRPEEDRKEYTDPVKRRKVPRSKKHSGKRPNRQTPGRPGMQNEGGKKGFLWKLVIAFQVFSRRVTSLRAKQFSRSFHKGLRERYLPALESIYHDYEDIMIIDPDFGERIWDRIRQDDVLFVELLREFESIYDQTIMREILSYLDNYPRGNVNGLLFPLMRLYQNLYFLRYNHTALANAFRRMYYHWGVITKRDATFQAGEARHNLEILVEGLLPRLHSLFCLYADEHYKQNDERVPERLRDLLAPVPGEYEDLDSVYLDAAESLLGNSEPSLEEEGHPAPAETENSAPAAVQQDGAPEGGGTSLEEGSAIYPGNEADQEREPELKPGVDLEGLAHRYDTEGTTEGADTANRLVPLFLLFRKFYQEYSFVLGSARIQFARQDTRNSLLDLFHEAGRLNEELAKYIRELKKHRAEAENNTDENYYRKALEDDNARARLHKEGKELRNRVKTLMEGILADLSPVNMDLGESAELVANPYDEFRFESFEAGRELDGATVKQALEETEAFTRDFLQRFEQGGEFAGGLEFSREEYDARYSDLRQKLKAKEKEVHEIIQEKRAEVKHELERENRRLKQELDALKREKEEERERLEKEKLEELKEKGLREDDSRLDEEIAGIRKKMEREFEKYRKQYDKKMAEYKKKLSDEVDELKKRQIAEYNDIRQYHEEELAALRRKQKAGKTIIDYRSDRDEKLRQETEEAGRGIKDFEMDLMKLMMERFEKAFGGSWERHLENYRFMENIKERRESENRDREHLGNPYNILEVASLGEKLEIIQNKKFWNDIFHEVFQYLGDDSKSSKSFFNQYSRELTSLRNDLDHPRLTVERQKIRIGIAAMERLWDSMERYRHERQASRTN